MDIIHLDKQDFEREKKGIFDLLFANMSIILPTGNDYNEDYATWNKAVSERIKYDEICIILIKDDDMNIVGYLQYSSYPEILVLDECQVVPAMQGKGILRVLFGEMIQVIGVRECKVRAYANKANARSQSVLEHFGLVQDLVKANNIRYCGEYAKLLEWYNSK